MAFEGYSQETLDFLWGIRFNNERGWFLDHKKDYESYLLSPTRALGEQVYDAMHSRFPKEPFMLKMSRIYRDMRRLHGNGPYKDHLWFCIRAGGEEWTGRPTFYFEIAPEYYSYGMGFYSATPAQMAAFRSSIDANPSRFERLAAKADTLGFEVTGEEYKRPKGDRGELINKWYNRKRMGLERSMDFGGELYSPALPETLAAAYARLMPMYEYFAEVYHSSGK